MPRQKVDILFHLSKVTYFKILPLNKSTPATRWHGSALYYEAEHTLLNTSFRTMERGMDSWCLAFTGCVASRADRGDDSNSGGNNFNGDERLLLADQFTN
eukprot:scaffold81315_cov104-Cyclotella_meneghiniana.AAC.2